MSAAAAFPSLSVVIPAYNAQSQVGATIDEVRGWIDGARIDGEIIIVDDGSADMTAEIARARGADIRVLRNDRNRGKGYSVRRGMLAAARPWVLFMDVDNSTRIEHLERFAPLAAEHDVLIASRRVEGARIVRPQPRLRQTLGRTFPYLVRAIALPDVSDTQCGFKLFRREAARDVFARQRVERFAFDVEILLLARLLGLRIAEVPINWDNPTSSTVRITTDAARMMFDVASAAWRLRLLRRLPEPRTADDAR